MTFPVQPARRAHGLSAARVLRGGARGARGAQGQLLTGSTGHAPRPPPRRRAPAGARRAGGRAVRQRTAPSSSAASTRSCWCSRTATWRSPRPSACLSPAGGTASCATCRCSTTRRRAAGKSWTWSSSAPRTGRGSRCGGRRRTRTTRGRGGMRIFIPGAHNAERTVIIRYRVRNAIRFYFARDSCQAARARWAWCRWEWCPPADSRAPRSPTSTSCTGTPRATPGTCPSSAPAPASSCRRACGPCSGRPTRARRDPRSARRTWWWIPRAASSASRRGGRWPRTRG